MVTEPPRQPTELEQLHLERLGAVLGTPMAQVRLLSEDEADRACERLAALLLQAFDPDELQQARFVPIPTSGHPVLGKLVYYLDLPAQREATSSLVVLVDDCALSGLRLSRALEREPAPRVVFAHLCSHEELREAALAAEERLIGCIAAFDLDEIGPAVAVPDGAREPAGRRYSTKRFERVAFPWSEPELPILAADGTWHLGWRFVSPARCLGNRRQLGIPPLLERSGPYRAPDDLVWALIEGTLWIYDRTRDQVHALEGESMVIWKLLAVGADEATVLATLADESRASRATLAPLLEETISELERHRLLEHREGVE